MSFRDRIQHAWNAFMNRDPTKERMDLYDYYSGSVSTSRPDRMQFSRGNKKTIVTSVYNRIAMDVAQVEIKHVRLDENERYKEVIDSNFNSCLSIEANADQTGRAFIQDLVMSMFDEGCVAVVPIDADFDPTKTGSYDIESMRVCKILEWYPAAIKVSGYDERDGKKKEIIVPKKITAIIENPFYSIMNEPNSTLQRLLRKLTLLDAIDERNGAGKLDLIIQLPYVIRSQAKRDQAEQRRKDIEDQLSSSQYGIAYTDGTERITQLNRAVESQLSSQVEYLTSMLYSQLGITVEILNGTADEKTMLNYNNRTIEPILSAITDEFKRKFLTKTARTQGQSIEFFRDPFKLVPIADLAELADKFTRNEIMTSNEIRQIVGMKPSQDPSADELRNKNLNQSGAEIGMEELAMEEGDVQAQLQELDNVDAELDDLENELNHSDEEMMHYASPYYDPVKAHEYYMRTRELKGRTSTAKLNDAGKAAAQYVKNRLNEERKGKVEEHKTLTDNTKDRLKDQNKATMESSTAQMKSKIESLRNQLKSLNPQQKAKYKESIQAQITSLREENSLKRKSLQAQLSANVKSLSEGHSTRRKELKDEYDEKYVQELEQIRGNSQFQAVKKSQSKKTRRR